MHSLHEKLSLCFGANSGDLVPFRHKIISKVRNWRSLTVSNPIHPINVQWGSGLGFVQVFIITPGSVERLCSGRLSCWIRKQPSANWEYNRIQYNTFMLIFSSFCLYFFLHFALCDVFFTMSIYLNLNHFLFLINLLT